MAKAGWKKYERVRDEAARLAFANPHATAKDIRWTLNDPELGIVGSIPTERQIQRWLTDLRSGDMSQPWVPLAAADKEQAARVLPVLAEVAAKTGGRVRLSHDLAQLVDRVVLAAPSVPPLWADALARCYRWAREHQYDTHGLDLTLALAPWQSQRAAITWAGLLHEMGEQPGGWPGGGPGIMALAARLPPPDWTTNKRESGQTWGGLLWDILTVGLDAALLDAGDGGMADSKVTAKPVDGGGPSETEQPKNPRHSGESGPG